MPYITGDSSPEGKKILFADICLAVPFVHRGSRRQLSAVIAGPTDAAISR
ncbi:MAG: hypothetical protein JWQ31_908 [Mycobacterium sp.]|jgi:hypothetical protein|nr:hypothetical protein [Mycobacterium sp.]